MMTKFPAKFIKRIPAIRQKWLEVGLSTAPVKRAEVEAALEKLYAKGGFKKPSTVLIVRSPRELALSLALLRSSSVEIKKALRAQLRDQLSAQLSAQLSDQLSDQLRAQLSAQLRDQLSATIDDIINRWWWYDFGQFDAWWCSYYDAARELGFDTSVLDGVFEYTTVAGWSMLFPDFALVSERPTVIHRDDRNRLHCETGPAVAYRDGFAVYAVHGVRVPADIIDEPKKITVQRIEAEPNAEIRRVMIERYGALETRPACMGKYLMDSGAEEVHRDAKGILYRKHQPSGDPILMVKVINSTAEGDGSFKEYFLPVHHELKVLPDGSLPPAEARAWLDRQAPQELTAANAVASTFGKAGTGYTPIIET